MIHQGDIYWILVDEPYGPDPGIPHPHVVVQDDTLNQSRIQTVVVCALTTNMRQAKALGNVLLEPGEGGLPKRSVVVVSQVSTVEKALLGDYIGTLSAERIRQIFAGMQFVQRMAEHPENDG